MNSIIKIYFILSIAVIYSCNLKNVKKSNHLVNETSPYLLQHVNNPVDWYPWGPEALQKAQQEDKLILISIGYAACHWCHVMEKESFQDQEVAKIMNEQFVCIKIDREERPDIDQIYMNAVQLMRQSGGWPLNCIALPDGKPIWGGTYFTKNDWINEIQKVSTLYTNNPQVVIDYADKLTEGIVNTELIERSKNTDKFSKHLLQNYYEKWSNNFDYEHGGQIGSPKFPLPNNYQFLLDYGFLSKNDSIIDYVKLTLTRIANGGIYDQIGGGFCRYSTDKIWKVPHFEKMLYDNAQLISLYSKAYKLIRDEDFKSIVYQTIDFVERELYDHENHAFYSSLDADSEGKEGKFYLWSKEELKSILKENYDICRDYYNINKHGFWEENYILLKKYQDSLVAKKHNISQLELRQKINTINKLLFNARSNRVRPALDDKCLTSWNGLILKAYTDAYKTFNEKKFLNKAIKNGKFILTKQIKKDGGLFHSYKNGKSTINGFLEDYAFVIEAFISLYEITLDETWLIEADKLIQYSITHFYDEKSGMFFFTSNLDESLIARKMEINDNVIPSSNSSLGKSLLYLGHILSKAEYKELATQMLKNIEPEITTYGPGYSNWASLMLKYTYPFYELVIVGEEAKTIQTDLLAYYLPNTIIIGSEKDNSQMDILKYKYLENQTMIYICQNGACQRPTKEIDQALTQIIY